MNEIQTLLSTYPRKRPPLTPAHEKVYAEEYKKTRSDGEQAQPLLSRLLGPIREWMHRKVAAGESSGAVLELGAGTLNHLPFETAKDYDIVEPFTALFADNKNKARLRNIYNDIRDIPESARYGRIVSVAVLEHLEELPYAVARSGLMLAEGGTFRAGIPAEGGLLWGTAWRCSTGVAYKLRTGLDYGTLMRHEHINRADEILAVVRHCFAEVNVRYFPLPFIHGALFLYIEASKPKVDICREVIEKSSRKSSI